MPITLQQLYNLIHVSDDKPDLFIHTEDAKVVAAKRIKDCTPSVGARIDLVCAVCGERVTLGPIAVQLVESGAVIACFVCVEESTGIPRASFPEGESMEDQIQKKREGPTGFTCSVPRKLKGRIAQPLSILNI